MKKLHEFTVDKKIIKREETKTDEGTLVKDVESTEPVGLFIKLPQRREIEQMRVIQSAEFGKAIAAGTQTREAMRAAILDGGGFAYAKVDIEELDKILPEMNKKKNEYQKAKLEGLDTTELEKEFGELYGKIQEMEGRLTQVYEHSAESIAERNTVLWAVLNLTFWADGSPLFSGNADESKMNKYYEFFDEEETFQTETKAFAVSYLLLDAYLFKGIPLDRIAEYYDLTRPE